MNKDTRQAAIEAAEQTVGSKLPSKLRRQLIDTGEAAFVDPPDGVGVEETVFKMHPDPQGAFLFADPDGHLITEIGGWDDSATGWVLSERAFISIYNQMGDYVLLSPNHNGVASRFVFCDHEIGELQVWDEDVDSMLK